MKLSVATCYFPVSADIRRNARYVLRQMRLARDQSADVAHFPEACLSGYAGTDIESHRGFDWDLLAECQKQILALAHELRLWLVVGSAHRLTGRHKPHDSVYVITDQGTLIDRYDKRFCGGSPRRSTGDLAHYSPGDHSCVFMLKGIRCGVLICYDYAFPELYREYKRRGVQLMFHSYHAGHASPSRVKFLQREVGTTVLRLNRGASLPEINMPAAMQAAACSNRMWISCSNTSARHSCFASFFVRPGGVITGRLRRNVAGVLFSKIDTNDRLYDGTAQDRAMRGTFHTGTLVDDKRSDNRTAF